MYNVNCVDRYYLSQYVYIVTILKFNMYITVPKNVKMIRLL